MSAPEPEEGDAQRAGQLLSRANLLRVRGQLDDAIALVKDALLLTPGDPPACALLGDLYAAQGRPDQALPWLAMAVDAAPENLAYREKLRKLTAVRQAAVERGESLSQAAETPPVPEPVSEEAESAAPSEATAPEDGHGKLVRGIYIACGVIFVGIALWAGLLLRQGASRKAEPTASVSMPTPADEPTSLPVPPPAPATGAAPSAAPTPTAPATSSAGVVLRLESGVAYLNPATGVALRDAPVPVAGASKELLLREALRQAAAVSRVDVRVKTIEVQLKESGNARPALRARIGAIDAIKVSDSAPLSELLDLFTLVEWRADIR